MSGMEDSEWNNPRQLTVANVFSKCKETVNGIITAYLWPRRICKAIEYSNLGIQNTEKVCQVKVFYLGKK